MGEISRPVVGFPQQRSRSQQAADWFYDKTHRRPAVTGTGTTSVVDPAVDAAAVTIVCISDTHNTKMDLLPPGDILVHAGDLSQFGTFDEVQAQLSWLATLPHAHKMVIAGNHDLLLDGALVAAHPDCELERHAGRRRDDLAWGAVRYLELEALDLEVRGRSVRVFGSPWTPRYGNWALQYGPGASPSSSSMCWAHAVPPRTDVLLVHGPPRAHLDDGGKGCDQLLDELWRARPTMVVFGHIHAGRGIEWLRYDWAQSCYEAVAAGAGTWRRWLSLVGLAVSVLWLMVSGLFAGLTSKRQQARGTLLPSASAQQLAWAASLEVDETEPSWTQTVEPLATLLHIPHTQPGRDQLKTLDDDEASVAFKAKGILAVEPHIHFV
ncbi:hypothetical protein VD0002_g7523 [Verticillium dahliae]|uniref:Calcineurin-like phosphoesterase domain-containing protein n=1 Tax=Verticillium dahliae TaxID=27337 RepID=A0A2J8DJW7_VERDA|nr:Zinc-regulated transporter 2 [Verticillium dahliae VDG2]PNH29261.1 hypothetical protein BJF96_g7463 [Verticillium dahliae]PNH40361.1 hypothetical protein VD0004_g6631 [Verticillium dahliae]PNH49557.1 hypothetical protein VD0003_g7586 [Verticillium dahliae]PNH60067.1 hypothetical protein VD0002_g7523 [Verticillium dahliae]